MGVLKYVGFFILCLAIYLGFIALFFGSLFWPDIKEERRVRREEH